MVEEVQVPEEFPLPVEFEKELYQFQEEALYHLYLVMAVEKMAVTKAEWPELVERYQALAKEILHPSDMGSCNHLLL